MGRVGSDTGPGGGDRAPLGEDGLGTSSEGGGGDLAPRPMGEDGGEADLVTGGEIRPGLWSSNIDWLTNGTIFLR